MSDAAAPLFASVDEVAERFRAERYLCSRMVATVVFLATRMRRPLLVEGPAGVGKTDLAKVLSRVLDVELLRLQCYEGLDETKALYEWEYGKQLLYTQILREKIGELLEGARDIAESLERIEGQDDAFFSERFLLARPLLRAVRSDDRTVLLVDEIDKADPEFEAFLLEILSDFQVTVPELGTFAAKAAPLVILTSNNVRELSDALKRRCLHLYIDYPSEALELDIVRLKVTDASEQLTAQVVRFVQSLRSVDLKKVPSISETLDWARALTILNVHHLDEQTVRETLGVVLKHEGDHGKARSELNRLLNERPSPDGGGRGRLGDLAHG